MEEKQNIPLDIHKKYLCLAQTANIKGGECTVLPYGYLQTAVEDAIQAERERLVGEIESLTHYYRSKFSSDCSREETEEEKNTEMLTKQDIIALIQNNPTS